MANESRVFRLPAGMSTQVVANAVSSFLSSAKGMEVQSAETTEGYVVQGRQEKDGWKTIAGMRMATTVQMIRMDDNLNAVSYTHLIRTGYHIGTFSLGVYWDIITNGSHIS